MSLIWRNCENTSGCGSPTLCPDQFCYPGQQGVEGSHAIAEEILGRHGRRPQAAADDAVYTTVTWFYDWPNAATSNASGSPLCLALIARLETQGLLTEEQVDAAVDRVMDGNARIRALCEAAGVGTDVFTARQITRALKMD